MNKYASYYGLGYKQAEDVLAKMASDGSLQDLMAGMESMQTPEGLDLLANNAARKASAASFASALADGAASAKGAPTVSTDAWNMAHMDDLDRQAAKLRAEMNAGSFADALGEGTERAYKTRFNKLLNNTSADAASMALLPEEGAAGSLLRRLGYAAETHPAEALAGGGAAAAGLGGLAAYLGRKKPVPAPAPKSLLARLASKLRG